MASSCTGFKPHRRNDMRKQLESISHGHVKIVGGCVVARYGDWFYSAGDSVNVLTNTPRTLFSMIEFIEYHQSLKR